jgi:hypothetical protein
VRQGDLAPRPRRADRDSERLRVLHARIIRLA